MLVGENIKRALGIDKKRPYFKSYVQRTNAHLARYGGIAVAILELLLLINVFLHNGMQGLVDNPIDLAHAITYLVFCALSLALSLYAHRTIQQKKERKLVIPLIVYLTYAAIYGIINSYFDSFNGEPPLTFIFCMVASTCVFVIPPLGSVGANIVAFVVYNQISQFSTSFSPHTVLHYWVGWIIVTVVAVLRYQECRNGASYEKELRDASELDELTGLRNRRSLRKDFKEFEGQYIFVAMCDLDDFKNINDTYGHVEGDRVLVAFSEAVNSMFSDGNTYRYGGDEFLVISPCLSLAEFRQRIGVFRANFCTNIRHSSSMDYMPTTSVGYAYGFAATVEDLRTMVHIADASLYDVKRSTKGGIYGEEFHRRDAVA